MSGVFQTLDPPTPSPSNESVLSPHQRRGVHTLRAGEGGGVNISEKRQTLDWPLTVYNPSTPGTETVLYNLGGGPPAPEIVEMGSQAYKETEESESSDS